MTLQKLLAILAFINAHWAWFMAAGGVWIFAATKLATKWSKPVKPWYAVALHFVFVDLPSAAKSLNGKHVSILGFKFDINWSIPFLAWSTLDAAPAQAPDKAA